MSEGLIEGRQALLQGDRALRLADSEGARAQFELALRLFQAPEYRLGEAHAWRGLAQVKAAAGEVAEAETDLRKAIACYEATERSSVEDPAFKAELDRDTREGAAAAWSALAELLARVGRIGEAREALTAAQALYEALGDLPSAAGGWMAQSRVALREGHLDEAEQALRMAIEVYVKSGNPYGEAGAWLALSEVFRLAHRADWAVDALEKARLRADVARNLVLEGRILGAMGSLLLQQRRFQDAFAAYTDALDVATRASDREMQGYAWMGRGEAGSRRGEEALEDLLQGGQLLLEIGHAHGVATCLLRISEHLFRSGFVDVALLTAVAAQRGYRITDPVRGVGAALRMVVKSLSAMQAGEVVLAAAWWRAELAGPVQPKALEVAEFYRSRAPKDRVDEWAALSPGDRVERAEITVLDHVHEALRAIYPGSLESTAVFEWLNSELGRALTDETEFARPARSDPPTSTADESPPDDDSAVTLIPDRATAKLFSGGAMSGNRRDEDVTEELPLEAIEPLTDEVPKLGAPIAAYDDFYDPPSEEGEPPAAFDGEADDLPAVPAELRSAPPPADYADFYDSPESESGK